MDKQTQQKIDRIRDQIEREIRDHGVTDRCGDLRARIWNLENPN